MEQQLKKLLDNDSRKGSGHTESEKPRDENEGNDRKRLKERLKKSMSEKTTTIGTGHSSWMEKIFGIHSANQRMGKLGSRSFNRPCDLVSIEAFTNHP